MGNKSLLIWTLIIVVLVMAVATVELYLRLQYDSSLFSVLKTANCSDLTLEECKITAGCHAITAGGDCYSSGGSLKCDTGVLYYECLSDQEVNNYKVK